MSDEITEPQTGHWVLSLDEEHWPHDGVFATRDEALANAAEFVKDRSYIVLDGSYSVWLGKVVRLSPEEVAEAFLRDVDDADIHATEQDEWGWVEDGPLVDVTDHEREEMLQLLVGYVKERKIAERTKQFCVTDIEKLTVEIEAPRCGICLKTYDDCSCVKDGRR